ncbi:hypothetical protein [Roseiconus lacunae]|uniref:hypothetical protein n=1 Tax=Roseiconus lacunae TaxID=2605694 RepID=UPI001E2B576A|nr:hypothetical protein [Roseiconus lacunae]MCD0461738.1 hypothetical protein [Roseiconus lacunae]
MKTPFVRGIAAAIGLTVGAGIALETKADEPSKWSSFQMPSTSLKTVIEGLEEESSGADQIQQVAMQHAVQSLSSSPGRPVSPYQTYPQTTMPGAHQGFGGQALGNPGFNGAGIEGQGIYPPEFSLPQAGHQYSGSQYQVHAPATNTPRRPVQPSYPASAQPYHQAASQPSGYGQQGQYAPQGQSVVQGPAPVNGGRFITGQFNAAQAALGHYSVAHQHGSEPAPPAVSGTPAMAQQGYHGHHGQAAAPLGSYGSPYEQAASAPWQDAGHGYAQGYAEGTSCTGCESGSCGSTGCSSGCSTGSCATGACGSRGLGVGPISPWYGGLDILFWDIADSSSAVFVTDDNGMVLGQYSDLDPDNTVGFSTRVGRYLGCGAFGIDIGFMYWDPDPQSRCNYDTGAGLRFTHPAVRTVSINRGGGATTVYDDYDMNATYICSERDIRVKGIEINLSHFGLLGARRLGSCYPGSLCGVLGNTGHSGRLFGGATGPLARACGGRLRVRTSHGFRWFQLEDELLIAGDVDMMPGLSGSDIYYELQTENNLYGYQFGSQLTYCLGSRLMVNVGGKIGVYGNDASFTHWIGNDMVLAYTDSQGAGAGDLYTDKSDVSLAGLGELDFGVGYRISNRLTATGGYRILSACGVATSIDSMPDEYTSVESAGRLRADDCFTMLGAYFGFNYNW